MKFYIKVFVIFLFSIFLFISNSLNEIKWIGITSSSDNHFNVSLNFVISFFVTHPNNILIYYDMELKNSNKERLLETRSVIKEYLKCSNSRGKFYVKLFNFSIYPKHFSIGNYTWKQIMIYDTIKLYNKMIFWFDSGIELTDKIENEVILAKKYDFYMPKNYAKLLQWLPIKSSDCLNISRNSLNNKCDGDIGYLAINYNKYMIENIIKKWVKCAYNPMCICPPGSSRNNSRYDQATFTALLYSDKKYSRLVGSFSSFNNHKRQCDHRKDCKMFKKYVNLTNYIKKCHSKEIF